MEEKQSYQLKINNNDELLCPVCGFHFIHHGRIEIFNRAKEDAHSGICAKIDEISCLVGTSMEGNPSNRRNGIRINLEGECGHKVDIIISQHKGQTLIYIDIPKSP